MKSPIRFHSRRVTVGWTRKNESGGRRYSSGYALCPDLDDQQGIFKLLRPESIGVSLTEGSMMEPEASVSAMLFQHPDCIYFDVTK